MLQKTITTYALSLEAMFYQQAKDSRSRSAFSGIFAFKSA